MARAKSIVTEGPSMPTKRLRDRLEGHFALKQKLSKNFRNFRSRRLKSAISSIQPLFVSALLLITKGRSLHQKRDYLGVVSEQESSTIMGGCLLHSISA